MNPADFVVRGGGIIGICIARELKRRYGDPSVAVLEKAPLRRHARGRSSGVIPAGYYYSADSLKARFPRRGETGSCAPIVFRRSPSRATSDSRGHFASSP